MEAGIDEAGRGPVMGPLVVAGVATDDIERLVALGCKDSKKLTPANRERIARHLEAEPDIKIAIRVVDADVLDAERAHHTLNVIEEHRFAEVAAELGAERVVMDAADVNADRFASVIAAELPDHWDVVAEHKADDNHPTVAAASIIAKVTRDQLVAELGRRLERQINRPLGSGYPSDPVTQSFLKAWVAEFNDVPEGTRRSWKTTKDLLGPTQAKL
jgi:ribonuclease HII